MNVTVLLERVDAETYRAITSQPIALETEGSSREEAIQRLRQLVEQRLATGELIEMDIPVAQETNPWIAFAGVWKDHPDFEAFLENVSEHRRQVDATEGRP